MGHIAAANVQVHISRGRAQGPKEDAPLTADVKGEFDVKFGAPQDGEVPGLIFPIYYTDEEAPEVEQLLCHHRWKTAADLKTVPGPRGVETTKKTYPVGL